MAEYLARPIRQRLSELTPAILTLPRESTCFRIHYASGTFPTRWNELRYFGPVDARFDHHKLDDDGQPLLQDRGIIYSALDIPTCIAEVFQHVRFVDPSHAKPYLVSFKLGRPIRLLDLTDTFPVRAGGSAKVTNGPRSYSRDWSCAFYETFDEIEGLYYFSTMTNRPSIALYDRVLDDSPIPAIPDFHRALDDPIVLDLLHEACVDIGYPLLV
ncbi:MAG: RES family NAD+ phosphorylase [Gammaproteobacteria bacterium]|nr:RES family NAD+ phosphorylase [Gammaproteobacteria bacterium]